MELKNLVRPNILSLAPYSCARDEFKGEASVYVDANENPYNNGLNRYPDPLQMQVKALLAPLKGVQPEQIFLGNGSDEAIDLVYRIFCRPGIDNVVAPVPTYGMYGVCADVNDVEFRQVPVHEEDFSLDVEALAAAVDGNTKVVWICSPNNPAGNAYPRLQIEEIAQRFANHIVVVDEAYIDFSDKGSMVEVLDRYPNVLVLQTFSKAWGHAAMRLGIAFASKEIIYYFNNVKYPYNVNEMTQREAVKVLSNVALKERQVKEILEQRAILRDLLGQLPCVKRIFASDANFLLVRVSDANAIYKYLQGKGIVVRNRNSVKLCGNCLRITVGTPVENAEIFEAMKAFA